MTDPIGTPSDIRLRHSTAAARIEVRPAIDRTHADRMETRKRQVAGLRGIEAVPSSILGPAAAVLPPVEPAGRIAQVSRPVARRFGPCMVCTVH